MTSHDEPVIDEVAIVHDGALAALGDGPTGSLSFMLVA
jgi:hypothetical protein